MKNLMWAGKICVKQGYLEIAKPKQETKGGEEKTDNKEESQDLKVLSSLKKGQEIGIKNFETKASETSPPTRYNSGNIVLAMENAGKLIEDEELREQIKG